VLVYVLQVDKVIKKSVSMRESTLIEAEKKAKMAHGGNLSGYIAALVERDLSGETSKPNALSETIILDLATRLLGELDAQELRQVLTDLNQPKVLQGLLLTLMQRNADRQAGGNYIAKPKPLPKSG
jgi:predicted DNA binding CopG/RHH family protein